MQFVRFTYPYANAASKTPLFCALPLAFIMERTDLLRSPLIALCKPVGYSSKVVQCIMV